MAGLLDGLLLRLEDRAKNDGLADNYSDLEVVKVNEADTQEDEEAAEHVGVQRRGCGQGPEVCHKSRVLTLTFEPLGGSPEGDSYVFWWAVCLLTTVWTGPMQMTRSVPHAARGCLVLRVHARAPGRMRRGGTWASVTEHMDWGKRTGSGLGACVQSWAATWSRMAAVEVGTAVHTYTSRRAQLARTAHSAMGTASVADATITAENLMRGPWDGAGRRRAGNCGNNAARGTHEAVRQ